MKSYKVSGMSCAACSARVEGAVSALSDVESCSVNLLTGVMQIEGGVDDEAVIAAVESAGYRAEAQNAKNTHNVNDNSQKNRKRAFMRVAFLCVTELVSRVLYAFRCSNHLSSHAITAVFKPCGSATMRPDEQSVGLPRKSRCCIG